MSISTTVAPFLANSFAADRPMPSPAPVTIATLPLKLAMLLESFGKCGGAQRPDGRNLTQSQIHQDLAVGQSDQPSLPRQTVGDDRIRALRHYRAQRFYRVRPEVEARAGVHVLVGADPLEASQIDIIAMRQARSYQDSRDSGAADDGARSGFPLHATRTLAKR